MEKFSKMQLRIITERMWRSIDRIFSQDVKSFLESMTPSDKVNYLLCKQQLSLTIMNWWMNESLKPLMFEPEKAIYRTKEQVYCGLIENIQTGKDVTSDLLEYAMVNMLIVPNILILTEDCGIVQRYNKSRGQIKFVRAAIKDCVKCGAKYSDMGK